jgi:hypothetical protein
MCFNLQYEYKCKGRVSPKNSCHPIKLENVYTYLNSIALLQAERPTPDGRRYKVEPGEPRILFGYRTDSSRMHWASSRWTWPSKPSKEDAAVKYVKVPRF